MAQLLRRKLALPPQDPNPNDGSVALLKPVNVWRWAIAGLACALAAAGVVSYIMWSIASNITNKAALADAQLTALKSGLATAAGVAAIFGGVLALRRQWASEVEAVITAAGAAEERVIEIYANAAEALSSERAAARIAALFTLERLGTEVSSQAQAVCSLLCTYLQLPFTPPGALLEHPRPWTRHREAEGGPEAQDELAVRLVAQRILIKHLRLQGAVDRRTGRDTLWRSMTLDLSESTLIGCDFSGCWFGNVDFSKAVFFGTTSFRGATFTRPARFSCTTWNAEARFARAAFRQPADFDEASFAKGAEFIDVSFTGGATFVDTVFAKDPDFTGTTIRPAETGPPVQKVWPNGWKLRHRDGSYWLALPGKPSRRPRARPAHNALNNGDVSLAAPGGGPVPSTRYDLLGAPPTGQYEGLLGHDS
jgi:Pentapeptide repeats (9 copies)